ncbi:MAG: glycosyltransferase [Deltaproteobacteria bacterium]|nr:glycosyltransferase [Deltaproteobacteria bacterium]
MSARGKYIYHNGQKFFARGVSYGPFAPNSRGESYPEPDRVAADFALMGELGANLVRTYVTPPPWMFDIAAKYGLRLMAGFYWPQHLMFLDSPEMVRDIRNTVQREIAALQQFKEVIFAYSIGNEIRADIVRWYGPRAVSRFLAELYDIGKELDPAGLFTYSNYPSAEYLDLSFLDVISFNVYLHREIDFRRYLTHLMAITGERPLVLSETGMDTIREGTQPQAELLGWQSRAALELGLSGLVIFAFTDEWYTGGNEITDWAFGITTRERAPKPSFAAVSRIFRDTLPPTLTAAPSASVIVPAYDAAPTIARCIESLKRLNYPDYEIMVVDDGSADSTAAIAESAGVQALRLPHRGLAAARNAGLAAARGRIVAFIDADAEADSDWLYHLAEAITRRQAAAAGGQNFAPERTSALAAAIAAAPGQAQEVRLGDQDLAQLCGCNMAVDKAKLDNRILFDCTFTNAGDDVDFSWRLRDAEMTLAYAPGAIVFHERRTTIGAYLKQQRGYGRAEGLLFRKYPNRQDRVYGEAGWFARWFSAGSRIYYGASGRGLFQTIYPRSWLPLAAQVPLTFQWIAIAMLLAVAGIFDKTFGILGITGLFATLTCAVIGAAGSASILPDLASRVVLIGLWMLGPLLRSWERERVKWSFSADASGAVPPAVSGLSGTILLARQPPVSVPGDAITLANPDAVIEALYLALVRRGLTVARGSGYDQFDLQIIAAPCIRIGVMFLESGNAISVGWRTGAAGWRIAAILAAVLMTLLIGGFSPATAIAICGLASGAFAALALRRARQVPAVICAACAELAAGLAIAPQPTKERQSTPASPGNAAS